MLIAGVDFVIVLLVSAMVAFSIFVWLTRKEHKKHPEDGTK